ncbi:hypothetical protein [Methylomagnum sp.]
MALVRIDCQSQHVNPVVLMRVAVISRPPQTGGQKKTRTVPGLFGAGLVTP